MFLIYRWSIAILFSVSVVVSIVVNIQSGNFSTYFIYLTHLNICLTMFTTNFIAFLVTFDYFGKFNIAKEMPISLKGFWLLWNQSIIFSFIVSAFYWIFLYKGQPVDLNNILIHCTNSIILFVDILICKFPPSNFIFILPVLSEIFYALFTLIYQFAGGLDKYI